MNEGELIESCKKCLLVKTNEWHKKASPADLIQKRSDVVR